MDGSKEDSGEQDNYELHKKIFDNDLKKLNQIIKYNKDVIDKKVSEKFENGDFLSYHISRY